MTSDTRQLPSTMPGRATRSTESARAFEERFGRRPAIEASAPGRINLIGEHTDYNEGLVLPMAIARRCHVAASATAGAVLRFTDANADPEVFELAPGGGGATSPLTPYVRGAESIVRELAPRRGLGVDLAIGGDLPVGAGLASSAALCVALVLAIGACWGVDVTPSHAARLARRIEHEFAGVPCGVMDQAAICLARPGHALLLDCRSMATRHVPFPSSLALVVVDSRVTHRLADGEYARRVEACRRVATCLGVPSLRDADPAMLEREQARLAPFERDLAAHVLAENKRVIAFADALAAGDAAACARLALDSHASLRDLYRVSCAELDLVVEAASRLEGVYGARMTGAGFGGSAIVLCDPAHAPAAARDIANAFRARFQRECAWAIAAPGEPASVAPALQHTHPRAMA